MCGDLLPPAPPPAPVVAAVSAVAAVPKRELARDDLCDRCEVDLLLAIAAQFTALLSRTGIP